MIITTARTRQEPQAGSQRPRDERGFILITLGLLIIPIMIFSALAVDVSSWYSEASMLQRSADSAALAGVVWMPDITTAKDRAADALKRNGIVNGVGGMTTTANPGAGADSLRVCITEAAAPQYFAAVFTGKQSLTRCSTAQYNVPLQLGSPLNYFGGNESLSGYVAGPQPADAQATLPAAGIFQPGNNRYCNVRGAGGVIVGVWDRTSPPSSTQSNWYYRGNLTSPGAKDCGTPRPALPDRNSFNNGNNSNYCKVMIGSSGVGYWYRRGYNDPNEWEYYPASPNSGRSTCGYGGVDNSPIPTEKSPGMWAAVEGYMYGHNNGDVYSTAGNEHRDVNPGYWYSVDIPASGVVSGGNGLEIQAFDLSQNLVGAISGRTPIGDTASRGNTLTKMVVYKAAALKYDLGSAQPIPGCDTGIITPGTAYADTFTRTWKVVCTIATPQAGDRYYINVLSNDASFGQGPNDGGANGYALRAVAGAYPAQCVNNPMPAGDVACYGTGTQPSLSGFGDMEMFNGIPEGQPTQFYLADVTSKYAGKTLLIDLWDPGDGAPQSWVTIVGPSGATVKGEPISSSNCGVSYREYDSTTFNPVSLSSGPGGAYAGTCTIETSNTTDGNKYDNRWLRFKINLPDDYGAAGGSQPCTDVVANPTTTPGSCWWQVKYFTKGGSLADYTTWSARIIGDPVRLTH